MTGDVPAALREWLEQEIVRTDGVVRRASTPSDFDYYRGWRDACFAVQTRVLAALDALRASAPQEPPAGLPERSVEELITALRTRQALLTGEKWEVFATAAMMREAANRLVELRAALDPSPPTVTVTPKLPPNSGE